MNARPIIIAAASGIGSYVIALMAWSFYAVPILMGFSIVFAACFLAVALARPKGERAVGTLVYLGCLGACFCIGFILIRITGA